MYNIQCTTIIFQYSQSSRPEHVIMNDFILTSIPEAVFPDTFASASSARIKLTTPSPGTSIFSGFNSRLTRGKKMALLTPLFAFLYHLPQVYKWLLKPYYVASLFMSIAFLAVRKTPGICDHLATQREDGNSCDFDWVRGKCQNVTYCFSKMCVNQRQMASWSVEEHSVDWTGLQQGPGDFSLSQLQRRG